MPKCLKFQWFSPFQLNGKRHTYSLPFEENYLKNVFFFTLNTTHKFMLFLFIGNIFTPISQSVFFHNILLLAAQNYKI